MNRANALTVGQRLTEGKASLDGLDLERARRGDSTFGRALENKTIWRELLELELQDVDEQIGRICEAAGRLLGAGR